MTKNVLIKLVYYNYKNETITSYMMRLKRDPYGMTKKMIWTVRQYIVLLIHSENVSEALNLWKTQDERWFLCKRVYYHDRKIYFWDTLLG